ncbi:MAG: signal transduction histidine kinase [Crocinitomix sp.]|jgi:signal transduction histidine kinase
MFTSNEEILNAIIISTSMILFFAVLVIIAIIKYQNKRKEFNDRENSIKTELIKVTLEAKDQTMEYLSEKIHIDIQQSLSLAKLNLNKILNRPEQIEIEKISQVKDLIGDTINEIKSLSKELDPKYIIGHTLEENIVRQLNRLEKNTELKTLFNTSEQEINLNQEKQTFVYRIIQEAINNIITHANATEIKIELTNGMEYFMITIEDNGVGGDVAIMLNGTEDRKKGVGLINMKNRTKLINGNFTLISTLNKGTKITLNIPYDN